MDVSKEEVFEDLVPLDAPARQFERFHGEPPAYYQLLRVLVGAIITIEGTIGGGKSTLVSNLVRLANDNAVPALALYENIDFELLARYIDFLEAHPGKRNPHAVPFQMDTLRRRQDTYREALRHSQAGKFVLIDRSIVGDYVFAIMLRRDGHFSDTQWNEYLALMHETEQLMAPTLTLYLRCTPERARERNLRRHRGNEEKYPLPYFQRLHQTYEEVYALVEYPKLALDWNDNVKLTPPPLGVDHHHAQMDMDTLLACIYSIRSAILHANS